MAVRNDLIAQFRIFAQLHRLGQAKEDLGVWLIERYLFAKEYDYQTIGEARLDMLCTIAEWFQSTPARARYYALLHMIYAQEEGLVHPALVWDTSVSVERKRLQRARQRLFLAVRECL